MPGMPTKELPTEESEVGDVIRLVVSGNHSGGSKLDALDGKIRGKVIR